MKKSVKFTKNSLIILVLLAAFLAVFSFALTNCNSSIASAQGDNFTRVFPTNNYFQSANPTMVSANDGYLIIYDKDAKTLFVRPNDASDTYAYAVDFEEVSNLFILTDVAFLQADGKYFTIDLTDKNSTATERTLTSPERISSLASDGTYLYAHYLAGDLTIYDKNLDVAFGVDNVNSSDLVGKIVIAGEKDCLYAFTFAYGNAFFVRYDATNKTSESHSITQNITQAYVGDVVYALALIPQTNQKNVVCLDKQTGELLVQTDIYPETYFAYGNRLFTIEDKSVVVYTLSSDKTALSRTTSITMTGSDAFHLDHPGDLCVTDKGVSVADSGNKRIANIDKYGVMTDLVFEETPIKVTSSERELYCAFPNEVSRISGGQITKSYSIENVVDIAYLDKLYVLSQDGVYTAIGNSLIKIFDVENAKRITCAKDGTNVYLLTSQSVICIDRNGNKLTDAASGDFSDAIDLAIDYQGKAYVTFKDKITVLYKGESKTLYPTSSSMKATLTSACLDGENLIFTAEESFVGAMNVGATTKQSYTYNQPDVSICDYYFATANDDALNYSFDGRFENTSLASDATYLVLDKTIEGDEDDIYRYAYVEDKLVIIDKNDFNKVETSALTGEYVATKDTALYSIPYLSTDTTELKQGQIVTRISDVAGYDNSKWTIVKHDDNTYFVKSSDIEEYVVIVPEKDRVYGKANADRVGGLVNVYASPDKNSQLVTQIVDGSKLEILETLDDFYLVKFEDCVGYVEKSHIKIDGLTTVQIVAIVLAIIVALAGSAIFASIYLTRKNAESKKNDDKLKKRF